MPTLTLTIAAFVVVVRLPSLGVAASTGNRTGLRGGVGGATTQATTAVSKAEFVAPFGDCNVNDDFPTDVTEQCRGLSSNGASSDADCAIACCAAGSASCNLWQWLDPNDHSHGQTGGCWMGMKTPPCNGGSFWTGKARTKWSCVNDQCTADPTGSIEDKQTCESQCQPPAPPPAFTCDSQSKTCAQQAGGAYPDQGSCESACSAPATAYACHSDGSCVPDAGGTYANQDECTAQCKPAPGPPAPPSKYSCTAWRCDLDASGNYSDHGSCSAACSAPAPQHNTNGNASAGLSAGTKALLVFFLALMLPYVAGGVYIQRKRGETGFDSMPNRSFWAAMPGLIKDGMLFVWVMLKDMPAKGGYGRV